MSSFRGSRLVRHAAVDMFNLVADFERYPQFVPYCLAARIRHRAAGPAGVETLIAEMEVGLGPVRERFATRDTLDRERLRIRIVDLEGPFQRFESAWSFHDRPVGRGSRVEFSTEYEFLNPALGLALGPVFDQVFRRLAQAFERRADARYRFTK
jgi:coenzyme Q-binding protein COQ10